MHVYCLRGMGAEGAFVNYSKSVLHIVSPRRRTERVRIGGQVEEIWANILSLYLSVGIAGTHTLLHNVLHTCTHTRTHLSYSLVTVSSQTREIERRCF